MESVSGISEFNQKYKKPLSYSFSYREPSSYSGMYIIEAPMDLYETTDRHNINNIKINNCILVQIVVECTNVSATQRLHHRKKLPLLFSHFDSIL